MKVHPSPQLLQVQARTQNEMVRKQPLGSLLRRRSPLRYPARQITEPAAIVAGILVGVPAFLYISYLYIHGLLEKTGEIWLAWFPGVPIVLWLAVMAGFVVGGVVGILVAGLFEGATVLFPYMSNVFLFGGLVTVLGTCVLSFLGPVKGTAQDHSTTQNIEDPLIIAAGVVCALPAIIGLLAQCCVYLNCTQSTKAAFRTLKLPAFIAISVVGFALVGAIAIGVLKGVDAKETVNLAPLFKFVWIALILCVAFFLKCLFSIAMLSAAVTWTLYMWLFYSEVSFIPLISSAVEFASSSSPEWVQLLYAVLVCAYVLINSFLSLFEISWDLDFAA